MRREQDWMGQARAELAAARVLLGGEHWAWCCFTCQQAAEKALKALCERFRLAHLGHNLNMLCEILAPHVEMPEDVRQACVELNFHYIPTRYPDAFERGVPAQQFFEPQARAAFRDAEEVLQFAEGIIGPP